MQALGLVLARELGPELVLDLVRVLVQELV